MQVVENGLKEDFGLGMGIWIRIHINRLRILLAPGTRISDRDPRTGYPDLGTKYSDLGFGSWELIPEFWIWILE